MIRSKLQNFITKRHCTLLGVGPMSKNCVDAAIELSNEHEIPIMLIASRRQIEADTFGGGYVNNWTTEAFADYVINQDKKGKLILSRDHGGPWQSEFETKGNLSLRKAMESAKKSFQVDIESGFELIHIDTSVDIFGTPSKDEVLQRLFELYEFCWSVAQNNNRQIIFEIGTEVQSGITYNPEDLEYNLSETFRFCKSKKLPLPTFVVVQTGTCVKETRNVGSFDSPARIVGELPIEIQLPMILDICRKYDILMKEHNTDYLSDESLIWHPRLGIHAANVAPEFGVVESRAFHNLLKEYGLDQIADQFIELSYSSNKWNKWILPDSSSGQFEKGLIAGHYIFATDQFSELKKEAQTELHSRSINVDKYLKEEIKISMMRYLKCFRMVDL